MTIYTHICIKIRVYALKRFSECMSFLEVVRFKQILSALGKFDFLYAIPWSLAAF